MEPDRLLAALVTVSGCGGGVAVTVSVTLTVIGVLVPAGVIVIVPLYVPAARPVVFTDTFRSLGVVPVVASTEKKFAGVAVVPTLNCTAEAPALVTLTFCAAGWLPPI